MSLYLGENLISGQATLVGESRNIGQIIPSAIPLTDAGLHLLDGSLINGNGIYSDFVDYIASIYDPTANYFCTESEWQTSVNTYGVCGKFVYDSVANTVRLPKVTGIIEGTTDVSALGDLVEAGLPNITGSYSNASNISSLYNAAGTFNGAFYASATSTTYRAGYTSEGLSNNVAFDASRSSSIYGNSTTVQPQTIKTFYYIVTATSTKTDIQVDIDEIATDLNGKADVDLSNTTPAISFATAMNNAGIRTVVETYVNGTSWYRVYSDGWCEQGGAVSFAGATSSVSFLKNFINTNYNVEITPNTQTNYAYGPGVNSKTTTSMVIQGALYTGGSVGISSDWQACGYIN